MTKITVLPCLDTEVMAVQRKQELFIPKDQAAALGASAVQISKQGWYQNLRGERVDISRQVSGCAARKLSVPPDFKLPNASPQFAETRVQVSNETTLQAGARLLPRKVLALNFANGETAGGGFLHGARAQEECLCRSSALYLTLQGDPMYDAHKKRLQPDSSDWAILSPDVPVFRSDDGTPPSIPRTC